MSDRQDLRGFCFSPDQAAAAESLCEAVIPGSAATGPAVYLDSLAADMAPEEQGRLCGLLDEAWQALTAGSDWKDIARQPSFNLLRALAIEAYYSDFRQPGYEGPGAWRTIHFESAPMAARATQDWAYLRCFGG